MKDALGRSMLAWLPGKEMQLMGGDKCNKGTEPGGKTFGVGAGPVYNGNVDADVCEVQQRQEVAWCQRTAPSLSQGSVPRMVALAADAMNGRSEGSKVWQPAAAPRCRGGPGRQLQRCGAGKAILNRLPHHPTTISIKGESYRLYTK